MGAAVQDKLAAAIANHNYEAVARELDAAELQSGDPAVLEGNWPHALHLAGHIYNKKLEDARFVWKRIPNNVKQADQELQAVWRVLQCLWQRDYPAVWQALDRPWSAQLQPVMAALAEKLRAELLELIATTYSSVKVAKVASICGLTEQDSRAACLAAGWAMDEATGTLRVVRAAPVALSTDQHEVLTHLTKYMVHLEH